MRLRMRLHDQRVFIQIEETAAVKDGVVDSVVFKGFKMSGTFEPV